MATTVELMEILKSRLPDKREFEQKDFCTQVQILMEKRGYRKSDLIRKTMIDRTYGYQILGGMKVPGKNKVIEIALALGCTLEQCQQLLSLSGNPALYAQNPFDAVCIYSLNRHLSVMECEQLLAGHHLSLLEEEKESRD
jgi:hypothetical protein